MLNAKQLKIRLREGCYEDIFRLLYPDCQAAAKRYYALVNAFSETYGDGDLRLFSAPGRTEIGGNHTDHQHGRVLAGTVDLDIIAVVRPASEPRIRITSPGYGEIDVSLDRTDPDPKEEGSPAALVRGMAAGFTQRGISVHGFDACTDSLVYPGSGLSSSAAFGVLVGIILRELCGCDIGMTEIAKLAQKAENRWFGKPCGLMDQLTCAVGGLVAIDFEDPSEPKVEKLDLDLAAFGYVLCITGPIGSHADLTEAYADVPREMGIVAEAMGKKYLREIPPADFYAAMPDLLNTCPDRAILRAIHFFTDNDRVSLQADALRRGDFAAFLNLINESGRSSYQYLQNVYHEGEQRLAVALAESERVLMGAGACRIHGGGFAGTIQAFIPSDMAAEYSGAMERLFGHGVCRTLSIRPIGATAIEGEVV